MRRRVLNISIYTVFFLVAILFFSYMGSLIMELNAMDIYHYREEGLGRACDRINENEDLVKPEEAEAAKIAKASIMKGLSGSGVVSDVRIDYENKRIICMMMTDGIAQAVQDGNDKKWGEVCDLAESISRSWAGDITSAGLDGWDFCIVVLNDCNPKNVLATFSDGEMLYNCRLDADKADA